MSWATMFAVTLAVELAVSIAMLGRQRRIVVAAVVANLATHPVAWLLVERYGSRSAFVGIEATVVGVEAVFYAVALGIHPVVAIAASLTTNGASIAGGAAVATARWWFGAQG